MKSTTITKWAALLALSFTCAAQARVITVTTADSVTPPAGSTSLAAAIESLQDGDTISFNIPGAGPHFLETPPDGYPLIRASNITIDGYSQPGAVPNTNPILAANNAQIKIVLDSRNGNVRVLDFPGDHENDDTGYGPSESAVLGILAAKNVTIKGISILGSSTSTGGAGMYGISFAKGANGHISGCWIGIAPDGETLSGPKNGITGFRYRFRNDANETINTALVTNVIVGVAPLSATPAAELNVFTGISSIPIIIEGEGTRISGNFLNVYPSGVLDFNPPIADPDNYFGTFEGNIELGRDNDNTVIGVDGDGVNDAFERNVFSGVLPDSMGGYDHNIEFYGQTPGTNIVIAGNYIGIGVDGITRFTNGVPALNAAGGSSQIRFGSDLDGVSDALEGNVVYNNWPKGMFEPYNGTEGFFDELSAGGFVSARGNTLVNNFPYPVSTNKLDNGVAFYDAYYAKALVDVAAGVVPTLSTNTSLTRLIGTVPVANQDYPHTSIDLYAADPEGIANGMEIQDINMPNGWVQGKTYIATFVDNSAADRNKTAGQFDFDISTVELKGSLLTITANYAKTPLGTRNHMALTSPFSEPVTVTFSPGSIESAGLTRIVPDRVVILPEADALGNWEPYAGVLGNSHFLIEGNTFAAGTTDKQRYVVMIQPVTGGAGKLAEGFYADNGTPFSGAINLSRQNGNPGRVAGDTRPGAVNYIVGGETSVHALPEFQGDNRWNLGFDRLEDGRFGTIQTFKLDPATSTPTPLSDAIDSAHGRLTEGTAPGNQITRFGGDVAGLDNGNFVSVVEDRARLFNPEGNAIVATIFAPDGTVVKESFLVANGDAWSNVAPFKGGFAVRGSGVLYFFDNAGTLLGQTPQSTSGFAFDTGRGDGTRIGGHINSPYVYLAGKITTGNQVKLAVWDSRDRSFVTAADVSEGAFSGDFDRVNLAVDALNRVTVAWVSKPEGYTETQVAARVMAFDPTAKTITALTKSFLAFVNAGAVPPEGVSPIRTLGMSVAMTTKQILIAAKGEINLQNRPELGADSPREANFYTVFTHPAPQEDPTPGANQGPRLTITRTGNQITITWDQDGFTLQSSNALPGNWSNVTTTGRSYTTTASAGTAFFRLIKP